MNSSDGRRGRDLERVSNLLDGVVSELGKRAGVGLGAALWTEWRSVAGPDWAEAWPVGLKAGALVVAVPNGLLATRLTYGRAALIERITTRFGPELVSSVRIKVAHE